MEYDIIGDIHGNAHALNHLLEKLGYRRAGGGWSSPQNRMIIFLGDFIDRGEGQMEVVSTARSLIDSGRALAVMGNHELNAISWHMGHRPDNCKNRNQHKEFLAQVGERSERHAEIVDWFLTLPLWLDLPELRVIHACWDPSSLEFLKHSLVDERLTRDQIATATVGKSNSIACDGSRPKENELFSAVETILKGIEIDLPAGISFPDKDGNKRHSVRLKWWYQPPASYARAAMAPLPKVSALDAPLPEGVLPGYDNRKPLFIGHYWMTGEPRLLTPKIACVDYSAGKGGPLVAYRWRGEVELVPDGFVSA